MSHRTEVIYNGACPICSREIALYRRRTGAEVGYVDLHAEAFAAYGAAYGLTEEAAARSFHVVEDGTLIEGVDAFAALWRRMPGFRWLAWLVGRPGVRPVAGLIYRRLLAPALYRMHLRRRARASGD